MSFEHPKSEENKDGFCPDTLYALVERGPIEDGDIPSKSGRNDLIEHGYAVNVIVNGQHGYTAATALGAQFYINHVAPGESLKEAIAKRRANWAILKARQQR